MGRLIPAGTGLGNYTRVEVLSQGGEEETPVEAVAEVAVEIPGRGGGRRRRHGGRGRIEPQEH